MAKGSKSRHRKKQKKLNRQRRLDKKRKRNSPPLARQVTPKLSEKIEYACDLVSDRKLDEAEELLDRLAKRYGRYPSVAEAQVFLYQATKDHESCCQAARRWVTLAPRDPDALLIYAQESMFCGRVGIALTHYRQFMERWPNHANAKKARAAIGLIEEDCQTKIRDIGFDATDIGLLVMFEEMMEQLQAGQFENAAQKCLELLKLAPYCIPARNNLALCYFHAGAIEKAVRIAEETYQQYPENRFAEAALGKLRFLTGEADQANAIADQIVIDPPMDQDALAAAIELLSFLGRDENIIVLSEAVQGADIVDPRCRTMILHHLATAQCRLGNEKAARASWKKCLKLMPTHTEALENLADLQSGEGHAPWFEPLAQWIPRSVIDSMFGDRNSNGKTEHLDLVNNYPAIAALVPALLERGDPLGRELALRMAIADGSPAMLDALQQFAFGSRGPDKMRRDALKVLREAERVDAGPHRFFCRRQWTDIQLVTAEITWEAKPDSNPQVQQLVETGIEALQAHDYSLAEDSFRRTLEKSPDNCSAAYNLCVVWFKRDGKKGRRRAIARLEDIHARFPDYLFAPITLAQFAAIDGDLDRATDLLKPIMEVEKLHVSEATALFTTQIQIALKRRDFELAEQTYEMLVQIADEDDPRVLELRWRIDSATTRRSLGRLVSLS